MKAQQKEKHSAQPRAIQSVLSKQLHRLVELWLSNSVDDNYQNRVMSYLDQFESKEVQLREIKKEIELTLKKQSPYFMIHHLVEEREQLLSVLEKEMQNLQQYSSQNNEQEPDLQTVCNILNGLRQSQMLIVESIMQLAQKYKIKRDNGNSKNGYEELIAGFSEDLCFIKKSVLKYYIPFGQEFDPLFVQEAKLLRKRYKQNSIVYNKSVEKLLALQPSYMYRLLRAKKNMQQLISVGKIKGFEELNSKEDIGQDVPSVQSQDNLSQEENAASEKDQQALVKQKRYYNHQQQTKDQSENKDKFKKLTLCFKLDNSAYLSQHMAKSRANTPGETINAYEQKYEKLKKVHEVSQFQRNRTLQIQSLSPPQDYYNRRLRQQDPEVPSKYTQKKNHKQIQRLKISPPILKIDIRSQIKNRKESVQSKKSTKSPPGLAESKGHKEVKVFKEEGTQHSQIEIIGKNKKFYLLQLQKDSKVLEESSYPVLKRKRQLQETNSPTSIRQRKEQKPNHQVNTNLRRQLELGAAPKKHKNFSPEVDYSGNQQFERNEMQYKATYKNLLRGIPRGLKGKNRPEARENDAEFQAKKLEASRQQMEQENSLQQKQREIIAKINRKYKLLALKQKKYQLSKLGHIIYHRMRQKYFNSRFKSSPKRKEYLY